MAERRLGVENENGLRIWMSDARFAAKLAIQHHYLHRRPPISFAYVLWRKTEPVGLVTYGVPASRHLQKSACPTDPSAVRELNRLWLHDSLPKNTASWFVSRTLRSLPPFVIVSYADPRYGHTGYVYRALNFHYAGWTDMDRKTPRFDYIPLDPSKHTREAMRSGYSEKRRRVPKVKYWTVSGSRVDRRRLESLGGWPRMDWKTSPPPVPPTVPIW